MAKETAQTATEPTKETPEVTVIPEPKLARKPVSVTKRGKSTRITRY